MTLWTMLTMAGAMLLLALTPGPGVFATVSRALASGFKASLFVIMGIVTGDLIFLLFAIFGLSALASLLGDFFILVKYMGALYLLWLGWRVWTSKHTDVALTATTEKAAFSSYLSGLMITLGNPKVILFYLGFLPTFIDLKTVTVQEIFIIALIVSTVLGLTMLGYAYMAAKAKQMLRSSRSERIMHRVAGGVMITTGAALLAKG